MAYYLGMMSGTSLDGIDAVLAEHHADTGWRVVHHCDMPMPTTLKTQLLQLNTPRSHHQQGELHAAITAEYHLTRCYADTYHQLIQQSGIDGKSITAIGAHGQTIRHEPDAVIPYTVQLLNGALLAQLTDTTVVCDFRRKDIAAGGQGAPLAPLFHQKLFHLTPPFAVVNIGGISNISLLGHPHQTTGFDCGPGNCLLDEWVQRYTGHAFDNNGQWASQGQVITTLLDRLLTDAYFSKPPPKSTGRDYFNQQWLTPQLMDSYSSVDVMRTLVALTAKSIALSLSATMNTVVIVGGGAKNPVLLRDIQHYAPNSNIISSEHLNIDPQHVEALGFAMLSQDTLLKRAVNTPPITGASEPVVLGAVYY